MGSKASRWFARASAASISSTGVPASATSVSAAGSCSTMPLSPEVVSGVPSGRRPRVPPPRTERGPDASRTASANSASEPGRIMPGVRR